MIAGAARRPLVGIAGCRRHAGDPPLHVTAEKYVASVTRVVGGLPFIIPPLDGIDAGEVLDHLDGLYLPGAPSNVEPRRYGDEPTIDGPWDPARDATTLGLVRAAVERGIPIFGICRGLQEINVALGGTLHQAVHRLAGRRDHRCPSGVPHDERYRVAHRVESVRGGLLAALLPEPSFAVNSAHDQAIDRLAPGLYAEAFAEDGTIEAASLPGSRALVLGVQWHPESPDPTAPLSSCLFAHFGRACRARRDERA
ncbi:MAG TPA: gamma-glutamyl-gamma-aminobutyrate hydrolase family protein [Kofleriaceae bacterium]